MSQAIVRSKLISALSAWAAAQSPPIPLARENSAFSKPLNSATFMEPILIPANTALPNVAADRRRFVGTFQVSIWSKEGGGAGIAEALAEQLCQLFTVFPKNQLPVSIESPGSIKGAFVDISGYYVVPVLFSYRMEAEN